MSRRRRKRSEQPDESWLLPYSDMLTLLVALFIVLFSMSQIDVQKYEALSTVFKSEFSGGGTILDEPAPGDDQLDIVIERPEEEQEENIDESEAISNNVQELHDLRELEENINSYIEINQLSEALHTELTNEGLLITILNEVTFNPGSAEVNREGQEIAAEISNLLHIDPPHQIVISGHADDRPMHNEQFASNWELSVMRAVNFMGLILQNEEHDPSSFSAKGFGEYQPIVPNTSPENRALNRRVEVLVLPNYEINVDGE